MSIAKLELLEIEFPVESADTILSKLIKSEIFHPEPASKFSDSVKDVKVLSTSNPYHELIVKLEDAVKKYHISFNKDAIADKDMDVSSAADFYEQFSTRIETINDTREKLSEMIEENKETIKNISYMKGSDINFDQLFTTKYLQVRFGRLPQANLSKLEYYKSQEFLYRVFSEGSEDAYILYVTSRIKAPEIDNIFSSLFFERIHVPEFVHGTVEDAIEELNKENRTGIDYIGVLNQRIKDHINQNIAELSIIYNTCQILDDITEAKKYVVVFGKSAAVYGFAEVADAAKIKNEFEQMNMVHVDLTPPQGDYRLKPPSQLKNNWFSKPFGMFVEMYGVPAYTDMDPTNFVAITYCLLFGIMFGDAGQGLVLIIVGFLASHFKQMKLGEIGMRIGIFSIIFGIFFGSVFGSEKILVPFFTPMDAKNTMTLLGTAIGIGAVLIIVSIIFNTYTNIKKKNIGEYAFSQNGLSGLVFYVCILLFVMNALLGLNLHLGVLFVLIGLLLPVVLMFLKEPLTRKIKGYPMFPEGFGSFFTEGFFELFDVLLTFITNTMSFLRVGGFVLSHAGMMLVVYTLAEMVIKPLGLPGYFIILMIGNIFVMVLEGLIVGIQVLRLEFYEMFSRYYEGNGRPFVSMKKRLER